jgi:hypothetical protein
MSQLLVILLCSAIVARNVSSTAGSGFCAESRNNVLYYEETKISDECMEELPPCKTTY